MARAQSDGGYEARAGWAVTWHNTQVLGSIRFPRAVDPASVTISVDSPDWVHVAPSWGAQDEAVVPFVIMPREFAGQDPLDFRNGPAGWVTLTVEAATGKDGAPLLSEPATLRLFMFENAMAESHPYLVQCLSSIALKPGSGGH